MILTSKSNPLIRETISLKEKKGRRETGLFLVEGTKMAAECRRSALEIERVILSESYAGEEYGEAVRVSDELGPDSETQTRSADRLLSFAGRGFRSRQYGRDYPHGECGGLFSALSCGLHRPVFSQERPGQHERNFFHRVVYRVPRRDFFRAFRRSDLCGGYARRKHFLFFSARNSRLQSAMRPTEFRKKYSAARSARFAFRCSRNRKA